MLIREGTVQDAPVLAQLLGDLDYPNRSEAIAERVAKMAVNPDSRLLVAETEGQAVGFISLHFIPQIALAGEFCRISYLCVSDHARGSGIGQKLLDEAERLAADRGCDRMEVHSHTRRVRAHTFYARAQYEESPKYLLKKL
ncbi:GNAT family N-acetyltransferase [Rahnella aceris]|jgi:GNAT superfamily N-acetyltransferase|uniref:GNAT family N-acetyltransferase n=1 Tax=Rahnella sp. (strain Y9602) TaxID=2703885 RepID=A0ABW6C3C3_RAHSY|nr:MULTISPECIES: GNAT family N-acetyltransferase [Rahnella]AYA08025.1 GNAT family N-acetyltransferase [Rahnella aquatilis]AZP52036.1 GNAT family N-acetyltransferase [Rahnella aquatilis]MBU9853055.1 GNAT family N-acetyltransferase [Rahnella aceris]MCM2444720.1 GNAT family N-acetyltransferase [Rahnella sp. CG8]MQB51636.1 GNAT family N-acetyltransferase [Rahnella sp. RcJ3]